MTAERARVLMIAHLDAHTYDAVVLDLLMPRAKNVLTPVIVISTVAETEISIATSSALR